MKVRLVHKGGRGSGHFGHQGRPGKHGGSLPGGGGGGGYGGSKRRMTDVPDGDKTIEEGRRASEEATTFGVRQSAWKYAQAAEKAMAMHNPRVTGKPRLFRRSTGTDPVTGRKAAIFTIPGTNRNANNRLVNLFNRQAESVGDNDMLGQGNTKYETWSMPNGVSVSRRVSTGSGPQMGSIKYYFS